MDSGDVLRKEGKCSNTKEHSTLTLMSANANSLKNKMLSLKFIMDQINPHVIIIQETKLRRKGQINLQGYRCYLTIRGDSGGGILVACQTALDPVLIFEGDNECEVCVVQIALRNKNIRIVAGYGPQECAPVVVRESYRHTIEEQVMRANMAGCSVVVAEDSNAKLGPEWIPNDPHPISENGKLLANMIIRQKLEIVNTSPKCTGGPITRKKIVNGKVEASCIDFILLSHDLVKHLDSAMIDSSQI